MSDGNGGGGANPPGGENEVEAEAEGFGDTVSSFFNQFSKMLMFYMAFQFIKQAMIGPQRTKNTNDRVDVPPSPVSNGVPLLRGNLWADGEPFDLRVYISDAEEFRDFYGEDAVRWNRNYKLLIQILSLSLLLLHLSPFFFYFF